ncbi:MAG: recombinase family protein [Flavobacteriaceae bacterium]|nr:recombinase family protein [Flavobacteriaceae bacterium]
MIYVYSRVSSTKQIEGLSLSLQGDQELLNKIALEYKTEISSTVYRDEGKSAFRGKNLESELGTLISDIENGKIVANDIIVMRHLDRLSRLALVNAMTVFTNILSYGVKIYTTMDNREYSQHGKNASISMILATLAFQLSNEESIKKSYLTNTYSVKRVQQFQNGERGDNGASFDIGVGGIPFHCRVDNKTVVKHELHFPVCRELVDFALAGNGISRCRDWLEDTHDIKYTKQGVSGILKSHSLYGKLIVKIQDRDAITMHKEKSNQDMYITNTYNLDSYYPAVCTEAEYYLLQHNRQKSNSNGNRKSYTLLAGKKMLFCGECNSSLSANHTTGKKGAVYYSCINQKCSLTEKIYTVDRIVVDAICQYLLSESSIDDSKINSLEQELLSKSKIYDKNQDLILENPDIFNNNFKIKLSSMKRDIDNIELELEAEQKKILLVSESKLTMEYVKSWGDKKELIVNGDSNYNRDNGEKIAKLVKRINIFSDGLIHILLIDNESIYYYLPDQIKTTGRRMALQLLINVAEDPVYQNMKNNPIFKMTTFTQAEILNKDYRCHIDDIHPDLLKLYSEESTRFTALDKFVNNILDYVAKNDFFLFNKKYLANNHGCSITDKQWQSHKTRAKTMLINKTYVYSVKFITEKGNHTEIPVVGGLFFDLVLPTISRCINAKEIISYSLITE